MIAIVTAVANVTNQQSHQFMTLFQLTLNTIAFTAITTNKDRRNDAINSLSYTKDNNTRQ